MIFKKELGPWDSTAIVIAIVVGVGIFKVPSEIAGLLGDPSLVLWVWLAGGLISLLGAFCYAELSSAFPKAGGNYVYLSRAYGPLVGFLFGWSEFWVIRTGSIAAMSLIFAEYLVSLTGLSGVWVKPSAVGAVLLLSWLNIVGLRHTMNVLNWCTWAKVVAVLAVLLLGLSLPLPDASFFQTRIPVVHAAPIAFGLALIPVLWTYGGWHENTFMTEETRDPGRVMPLALISALFIVMSLYLGINIVYLRLMPLSAVAASPLIGSSAMSLLFGGWGQKIFESLIVLSAACAINAMIMTGGRVTYAMSRDNRLFEVFGRLNSRQVPYRAILLDSAWSIVLILTGSFSTLLFFTGVLVWIFFALVSAGLILLRLKLPGHVRPYRVPFYPVIPIAFCLICLGLVMNTVCFMPKGSLIGLALALSGIPIFMITKKREPLAS